MAGFAVFMTLVMYGFVGLVLAASISAVLYVLAKRRMRKGISTRDAMMAGIWGPFLGLVWMLVAFIILVQISNRLAHQDCGLSGDPYVTLPNGYVLGSHNTYDGYIQAPNSSTDVPVAGPGYVRSIVRLKYADPYFIGTQFDFKTSRVRGFVFDTRTQQFRTSSPDDDDGQPFNASDKRAMDAWTDANTHAQGDETSYWTLYQQYRHHWPTYVFIALVLAGEAAISFRVWRAWQVRPAQTGTE